RVEGGRRAAATAYPERGDVRRAAARQAGIRVVDASGDAEATGPVGDAVGVAGRVAVGAAHGGTAGADGLDAVELDQAVGAARAPPGNGAFPGAGRQGRAGEDRPQEEQHTRPRGRVHGLV